jgi:Arc/MetJ-type ribon-helix-helix transcriptional regulator
MKTIHLTDEQEQFLCEAVHSGRYASDESVVSDALNRLRKAINMGEYQPDEGAEQCRPAKQLTKQEFQRHLVNIGLLDQAHQADRNGGSSDSALIDAEGEIVSEVVIRERLIEWLTGFLT